MKRKILVLFAALALLSPVVVTTGCQSAPSQRTVEVTTLKVLGASVDTTMKSAAHALKLGNITMEQWAKIADFHDNKFQPAYNLAVAAVQSDLSSVASPDLVNLGNQLADIILQFTTPSK